MLKVVANYVAMHVDIHSLVKIFFIFSFCPLDTNLAIPRKRGSQLRNSFHQIDYRHIYEAFFLINDGCGRTQPSVGAAPPGKVGLRCKQHSFVVSSAPAFRFLLQDLAWLPSMMNCNL